MAPLRIMRRDCLQECCGADMTVESPEISRAPTRSSLRPTRAVAEAFMAFSWFNSKLNPIAVDIGTDSIKILQIEPREDVAHLLAAACEVIPYEVRGNLQQREDFIVSAIRKLTSESGFKGRQAVTCLPASHMAMQHLRVAHMNAEELTRALPFEAQGKLPFDASRAVIKHVVAGDIYQDGENKQEVIVLAASRDSVDRHLDLFAKAKLELVGIHVEPTALIESFAHIFRRKGDHDISTLFVDLGAGSTHVVIAHGTRMVFAKHIQVGGDTLNQAAAAALKLTPANARQARIELLTRPPVPRMPAGVVSLGSSNPLGTPKASSTMVNPHQAQVLEDAMREPVDTLASELEMCVRYYESIFHGKQVDRMIFVGGESRHVAICQALAQKLNLPATLGDPLARLHKDNKTICSVDLRQPQPGWAIAVGLGLGIHEEAEKKA